MKAIILAANPSKNLRPFTLSRPKPLIRVADSYLLEKTIQQLKQAGITDLIIVVNHQKEQIIKNFEYGSKYGLKIEYVFQSELNGIGGALYQCANELKGEDNFLLVYGDIMTSGNIFSEIIENFQENKELFASLSLPNSSQRYGNVYIDHKQTITKLIEKPTDNINSNYVLAGVYVLNNDFLDLIEQSDLDMEVALQKLIAKGDLKATIWEQGWIDIDHPWHILDANAMIMVNYHHAKIDKSAVIKGNVHIEGAVIIEENVTIDSGSILKGPCVIGKNSYIGNNVLIRANTSIGPNSLIGYGCELKNCVLFGDNSLGRLSFIGDSVIGQNVQLGSGIITVNHTVDNKAIKVGDGSKQGLSSQVKLGSFIGDNTIIGSSHTIAPGTMIEPDQVIESLYTIPLK